MKIEKLFNKLFSSKTTKTSSQENTESDNIRNSTNRIINETDYSKAENIDEIDQLSKNRSDDLYEDRQRIIAKFDPYSASQNKEVPESLNSIEKYFLKSMIGQPIKNPEVCAYWFYEYSLDYSDTIKKLLSMRYLKIGGKENCLSSMTVAELKEILSAFNEKVSGKKAELLNRITSNISHSDLEKFFSKKPKVYCLTELGKKAIDGLPDSATKNLEFEDKCLECIIHENIKGAYKIVCENELKKIIPRGLETDWNRKISEGLPEYKSVRFNNFFASKINLPNELVSFEKEFKACIIFGIMLGFAADKIEKMFRRITKIDKQKVSSSVLMPLLQKYQFAIMDDIQIQSISNL